MTAGVNNIVVVSKNNECRCEKEWLYLRALSFILCTIYTRWFFNNYMY